MIDAPKTIEEARIYRYNVWAGNSKGSPYKEGKCAEEVYRDWLSFQCCRNNGHGTSGLYCKQHSKWRKLNDS